MRRHRRPPRRRAHPWRGIPATVLTAIACAALVAGTATAAPRSGRPLTTPPDAPGATAAAINDAGVVVGSTRGKHDRTGVAVRWDADGRVTRLPGLPDGGASVAWAVDDRGTAVGVTAGGRFDQVATRWDADGSVRALPSSRPTDTATWAFGVNDEGTVVGAAQSAPRAGHRALRWDRRGVVTELAAEGEARAVNRHGVVAGTARLAGADHAVRWAPDGTVTDLGVPPGFGGSEALAINDRGAVVGRVLPADNGVIHAQLWEPDGRVTDLGTLPGGGSAWATGINDRGVVVGHAEVGGTAHAVRWDRGGITDLGALPGADAGEATGINDRGVVVGWSLTYSASIPQAVRWDA
ncbi:hypothetical protein [Actinosynnema sp. NPDC020468]|uniref:hypothetical protein n=1 Tax=Actinosynnema sp. NPDC020468 TaxID=3154488 RepID=UPI00340B86C7